MTSIIVFVIFVVLCCLVLRKHITRGNIQYMWREEYIVKMKDISKVIDYLKVGSPHHVRSYFWLGGGGATTTHNKKRFDVLDDNLEHSQIDV